jgi:hypothetical protein
MLRDSSSKEPMILITFNWSKTCLQQLTFITFKQVLSKLKVIWIIGLQPRLNMQLCSINIDIKHLVDYQVVDIQLK